MGFDYHRNAGMAGDKIRTIGFAPDARVELEALGLNWSALSEIILGEGLDIAETPLLAGSGPGQTVYRARERRSFAHYLVTIKEGVPSAPSPFGDGKLIANRKAMLDELDPGLFVAPLLYGYGTGGARFWTISCDLTGRIDHIFLPELSLIIYDAGSDRANALVKGLTRNLARLEARWSEPETSPDKIVAILDMVTNYGHQMINHLSGLTLLVERGLHRQVDEVWIAGEMFFGDVDDLFPEFRGKIVRMRDLPEMTAKLEALRGFAVRVGSNSFDHETRARILRVANALYAQPPRSPCSPLIALTVRTGGRLCVNLGEVVAAIYELCNSEFPSLGFVVDGWVFPEQAIVARSSVATCLDDRFILRIREELAAATAALAGVPKSALARNLIGASILESIQGLRDVDVYLAHVGTLQHKIAFLNPVRGLVHGPTHQLLYKDGGAFQAEVGYAPNYLLPEFVEDVPGDHPRGSSFFNYRIRDANACAFIMRDLLREIAT